MKLTIETITRSAREARSMALNGVLAIARRRPELCACFGYGLTVRCDTQSYYVHLPQLAHDEEQRELLRTARLPASDDLLRLKRRTRSAMHILEIGSGNGIRAAFFSRSLEAASLRAVGFSPEDVTLTRKNVVLNDGGDILTQCEASQSDACATLIGEAADLVSLQATTAPELLELLRPMLTVAGPAVIVWEGGRAGYAGVCSALLKKCGYGEPERWEHSLFWMPRV